MKFEIFVALRYLRAKRKQTMVSVISAISVLGIAAGVMALVIAMALETGFREDIQVKILGTTPAVTLMRSDGGPLENFDDLLDKIGHTPRISGAAPAIYDLAFIEGDSRFQDATIKGIIPSREIDVSDFFNRIVEGDPGALDDENLPVPGGAISREYIMIGKEMARELGVSLGDRVKIRRPMGKITPVGRTDSWKTLHVGAVFETGLWDIDANWAYVNLETARRLFGFPPGSAKVLQFKTDDLDEVAGIAEDIRAKAGENFYVTTWMEMNRPLFEALNLEKKILFVTIGLIIFVASLNIVTSLVMMVMDKQGDISILAAMGATPGTIRKIFMFQGVIIGFIGTVIGDVLGIGISWILDRHRLIRLEAEVFNIPYVPFHVHALDVFIISATALLISYLATLYPSRSAAALDPVEVLRYE
ncbi:MAG: FtsX-like permease family protein [Acidobacteria bacterium]|nr:FtsX-like permease family protein [Acidobacteriota bacterium]